jgi:NAD(P)-dependent dehydrogenase (short-subunit alcohol dehydrogenase family)
MQFGVNHLGHWALTALLIGPILAADAGRIVSITSTAQHMGRPVDPENPHLEGNYGPWKAYGQSKLANLHFAIGLQRQFDAAGVRTASLAAHPGLTNSDLQAHSAEESGGMLAKFSVTAANLTGMDVAQGALSQLRAATDPEAKGGEFYGPRFVSNGPPVKKPILRVMGTDRSIAKLWTVSERETGITLDVAGALPG